MYPVPTIKKQISLINPKKATPFWWNQRQLECLITRWAIPGDVAFLRKSYLIHSLRVLAVRDHCPPATPSNVSAHQVFRHPFLQLFLRTTVMQCLPTCAGPFLPHGFPIYTWDWDTATMSFLLFFLISVFVTLSLHTTCSILRSNFRWQVWSISFSFSVSDHVWAPYNRTENTQDSKTCSLISGFWNLSASINPRLMKLFQAISFLFSISFPALSRNRIGCSSPVPTHPKF
jgi:hypothetical protein